MAQKEVKPFTQDQERFGKRFIKLLAHMQVWVYRLSGGRLWKKFNGGPVALFTMKGRHSGRQRTLPLVYARNGEQVIIAASLGGMSTHPAWYHNMMAHPEVEVQEGSHCRSMRVRQANASEEENLWPKLYEVYPDFAEYRERAGMVGRHIPLLVLAPR